MAIFPKVRDKRINIQTIYSKDLTYFQLLNAQYLIYFIGCQINKLVNFSLSESIPLAAPLEMQLLRYFNNQQNYRQALQMMHKGFLVIDGGLMVLSVFMLMLAGIGSDCLVSFYLFCTLFYLGQTITHYLFLTMPKIDVVMFQKTLKRLISVICFIDTSYMLLAFVFWQRSDAHPLYCALCEEYQMSYALMGILIDLHFCLVLGFLVTLIHLFITRKYYLIALGGFDIERKMIIEREQALKRIGIIEPNYDFPIESRIKSNKYYKFEDVQEEDKGRENNMKIGDECSICLNPKLASQPIVKTKCGHYFHRECVEKWSKINSRCPDCRSEFEEDRPWISKYEGGDEGKLERSESTNSTNNNANNEWASKDKQLDAISEEKNEDTLDFE